MHDVQMQSADSDTNLASGMSVTIVGLAHVNLEITAYTGMCRRLPIHLMLPYRAPTVHTATEYAECHRHHALSVSGTTHADSHVISLVLVCKDVPLLGSHHAYCFRIFIITMKHMNDTQGIRTTSFGGKRIVGY